MCATSKVIKLLQNRVLVFGRRETIAPIACQMLYVKYQTQKAVKRFYVYYPFCDVTHGLNAVQPASSTTERL